MLPYIFLRTLIILFQLLPFRLIYIFSDCMYYLVYYVIKYRRNVVKTNISSSFPDKSEEEITVLTKKYFHHLCDISIESIKGFSMSAKELIRRFHIRNPEIIHSFLHNNISIIAVPGHYNNWEWGSLSPGLQINHQIVGIYKPMSNKRVDAYLKVNRVKHNTLLAPMHETAKIFKELSNRACAFIMAADQRPTNMKDCYWFDFLHHDTPWIHGPEKYARLYNYPVFYVDVMKVRRGFYEIKLELITDNPASLPEGEITRLYAHHLEKSITHEPAYWLWSHNRWKYSREKE